MAEKMSDAKLKEMTQKVLSSLTPAEKKVLAMRFGFAEKIMSDEEAVEISQRFAVTRERIRQLEAKAFRHLKKPKASS